MKKDTERKISKAPSNEVSENSFNPGEQFEVQKTQGLSGLNVEGFVIGGDQYPSGEKMSDEDFTKLLNGGLEYIIRGCIETLRDSKYIKSDAWCRVSYPNNVEVIQVIDWLDLSVTNASGESLFDVLREDGEDWKYSFEGGDYIDALGMAAFLIVKDICEENQIYSDEWYAAKILQEYYWPKVFRENQLVLIGILSEQQSQKLLNEKTFMRGKSAKQADEKRGEMGKAADRKAERLEELLSEMEVLASRNPDFLKFGQEALSQLALRNVVEKNAKLWSQGAGQLGPYMTTLASEPPYKRRFDALFHQTA